MRAEEVWAIVGRMVPTAPSDRADPMAMTIPHRRDESWELLARIVRALEALEDGDAGLAYAILLDLEHDVERQAA